MGKRQSQDDKTNSSDIRARVKTSVPTVGSKINKLTVTKVSPQGYQTQCECGNPRFFTRRNLHRFWQPHMPKKAHVKTCGRHCVITKNALRERQHKHGGASKDTATRHWLYERLRAIIMRCTNTNAKDYPRYGGAGVTFYEPWRKDYPSFILDLQVFPNPEVESHWYAHDPIALEAATAFYSWFHIAGSECDREASAQDVVNWLRADPVASNFSHGDDVMAKKNPFWKIWSIDRIHNQYNDGSIGGYHPGNVRLFPLSAQAMNRKNVVKIDGLPLSFEADRNGIKRNTALSRYARGDNDPLGPLYQISRPEADVAINAALSRGILKASEDGRIMFIRDGAPTPKIPSRSNGYLCIDLPAPLCREFNVENAQVMMHRVIAIAFHGMPPSPIHVVDHIDGVKSHNCKENLRWVLPEENSKNRRKNELDEGEINKWTEYYKDPESYKDLVIRHNPLPFDPFEPSRMRYGVEFEAILDRAWLTPAKAWLNDRPQEEFLRHVLAAPGSMAEIEAEGVSVLVFNSRPEGYPRRVLLQNLCGTHRVRCCCPTCQYEMPLAREVREHFEPRASAGTFAVKCDWCDSVALSKRQLAPFFAEGEPRGESPFRVAGNSHRAHLMYCANYHASNPCKSPPIWVSLHARTKPPYCIICRSQKRPKNLGEHIRRR